METSETPTPILGRLLIVDDETEITAALCELLSLQNYDTVGCDSGEKALAALNEKEFDVLLTDMMMPGMNGIALLRASLEINPNLIGIVMTGQGTVQTAIESMKVGAYDYLLKPYRLDELMPMLARCMEKRRLREENLQLRESVAIYEFSQAIAFSTDRDAILAQLAAGAMKQCEAAEVSVMLPSADGKELGIAVALGEGRDHLVGQSMPIAGGIAGWVANRREPLLLHGAVNDDRFAPIHPREEIASAISIPMLVGSNIVGVMNVNALKRRHPFTMGQVKALSILANTAAAALDSARLHDEVRASELRYRSIFDNAIEGMYQALPGWRYNLVNPALAKMLGYFSPAEMVAHVNDPAYQLYVNTTRRSALARKLEEEGEVWNFESEVCRKNGAKMWISENARAIRDTDGRILHYEGIVSDITESAQAHRLVNMGRSLLLIGIATFLASLGSDRLASILEPFMSHFMAQSIESSLDALCIAGVGYLVLRKQASLHRYALAQATERQRAIEAMREGDERYRTLTEASHDDIFILDRKETFEYINHQGAAEFGLSPSEVVGKSQSDIFPAEIAARNSRNIARVFENGKSFSEEIQLVFGERTAWHAVEFVPLLSTDKKVRAIMGVSRDITERKEAEQALRASEERFRQMAETIDEVFWMVDPTTGQMLYISPSYERLWGRTRESLYDDPASFINAIHPEDRSIVIAANQDKTHNGQFAMEYRVVRPDGSVRWIWDQAFPVLDEEGLVQRVAGIAQDITERKSTEAALQNERDFIATVVDTVGSLVIVLDREGRIVRFNRACEQLTGYTFEEVRGRDCIELLMIPEEQAATTEALKTLTAGLFPSKHQYCLVTKDGEQRLIAWSDTCLVDATGAVEFVIGTGTDITVSHEMEEALRTSRDELEIRVAERTAELATTNNALTEQIVERQMAMGSLHETVQQLVTAKEQADQAVRDAERANAAKSEFLSRMSHELRTPMNSILGFAQILEIHAVDEKQGQRIGHIIKAGRHLLQLINEVLDMARVEGGGLSLSSEPICINNAIQGAVDLVRPLCQQRGLQIILELNECAALYVKADQQRLTQVLLNLMSNATKYNRQGGEVRIHCEGRDHSFLRIGISDTGAGIVPENLARLFQPFERLGADSSIEGTGLGLALSKRLIEAMGGAMGVESTPGVGSTFWLELPLTEGPLEQIGEAPAATSAIEISKDHTILYIEDNLANLQVIEHILDDYANIRLVSAMQGQLGIDLARQHRPALILLDLHLPDFNGDEVLRRLKSDPITSAIPIIMLSADASPSQIQRLKELGASDYITKPLDVSHFLEVIQQFLQAEEA